MSGPQVRRERAVRPLSQRLPVEDLLILIAEALGEVST